MATEDPITPKPGYVSWRTFLNLLDTLKADGVPQHIESRVLGNLSGTVRSQLRLTLRFLELVDDKDKTQPELEALAKGDQEERKKILQELLRKSYSFLFDSTDDFDLSKATPSKFSEKFASFNLNGDTRIKAEAFFISAAKFAEIPISIYITQNRGTEKKRPNLKGKPTPLPQNSSRVTPSNSDQKPAKPNVEDRENDERINGQYGLLHKLQIERLPVNGKWTTLQKEQYMKAYAAILDLLIETIDDELYEEEDLNE